HLLCRLGKLVIPSLNFFNSSHHISQLVDIRKFSMSSNIQYAIFHIPWSKTVHMDGEDIIATKINDITNPHNTLIHHLSANISVPSHTPLFAFETKQGWSPMTKLWFLTHCNNIWKSSDLPVLSGHCFRIRATTKLLLCGVPPD
ncbi:uncharacterized protein EDB91DRAFT_1030061, partial [Suillus paluster]|uniref:uncharacterized protein n=1 Tax=Suillus paluster TaxID=48578 RepID=UPI001B861520